MDIATFLLLSLSVSVVFAGGTVQPSDLRNFANCSREPNNKSGGTPCPNSGRKFNCDFSIVHGDLDILLAKILGSAYSHFLKETEAKVNTDVNRHPDDETKNMNTKSTVRDMTTETYVHKKTHYVGMTFRAMAKKLQKKRPIKMKKTWTIKPHSVRYNVTKKGAYFEPQDEVGAATDMKGSTTRLSETLLDNVCRTPYGIYHQTADTKIEGSCYALLGKRQTRRNSRGECMSIGGDLVAFETGDELMHVKRDIHELKHPTTLPCFWTSGERRERSEWVWASTGKRFSFTNWFSDGSEIRPLFGMKYYMYMGPEFNWLRSLDTMSCFGICEKKI